MYTHELVVEGRSIRSVSASEVVRTSVGVDRIHVLFDSDEWLSFPVTATFANGADMVTVSATVSSLNSGRWRAQSNVPIPWEVVDENGRVRVTLQGTDSGGNHIITAYGEPLEVVEAGDVTIGSIPASAPTMDQWQQAYADAMSVVNEAQTVVESLQDQLESMVSVAEQSLDDRISTVATPATTESLGVVMAGDGLSVDGSGLLSVTVEELTEMQRAILANVTALVSDAFGVDLTSSSEGASLSGDHMNPATTLKRGAVYPDGVTIKVDQDGMIHAYSSTFAVATAITAGAVKPDGTTITVDQDGTIHGASSLEPASTQVLGGVMVDGTSIVADENGVISVAYANANEMGF